MSLEFYALHLLTFLFGYITCRTFYFFKSSRVSVRLLKVMHVICLSILVKCIEEYSYAVSQKLLALLKCGVTEQDDVYKKIVSISDNEVKTFQARSIATIVAFHPDYFRSVIEFDDWDSAMVYLNTNKNIAKTFLSKWRINYD